MNFDKFGKELNGIRSGISFKSTGDLEVDVTDSPLQVFQARIQNFQTDAVQMHV
jgi:hypothetical protein